MVSTSWESFRNGPTHTGLSPLNGPAGSLATWTAALAFPSFSSPVQAPSGTIYAASGGEIAAYSPSGTHLWSWDGQVGSRHHRNNVPPQPILATPAITPAGNIVVGAENNVVYEIGSTGATIWSFTTGGPVESSAAISPNGTIYVGSDDGNLYALSVNGSLHWSFATGGSVRSSPAISSNGTIYVGSLNGDLYALFPNGTLDWSFATGAGIFSSPAITPSGLIVFGSEDDHLYALYPNGTEAWNLETGGAVDASPAIAKNGSIVIGSRDGNVYELSPNGTVQWTFSTGGQVVSSAAIDRNGTIYVGSNSEMLYALTPGGVGIWTKDMFDAVDSSPTVGANGTLLVTAHDGIESLGVPFTATFHESNLAVGTNWTVTLAGVNYTSNISHIAIGAEYLVPLSDSEWTIHPSSIPCGTGCVIVPVPDLGFLDADHSQTVNITFERRTLLFEETGLPNGTLWNVDFGGKTNSSRTNIVSFTNDVYSFTGTYSYTVGPAQVSCGLGCALQPVPSSGSTPIEQPILVPIQFEPYYLVEFNRTISHGGSMTPTAGSSQWVASNGTVALHATSGTLILFSHWSSNSPKISFVNANLSSTSATIGGPGNITAVFTSLFGNGGGGAPTSSVGSAPAIPPIGQPGPGAQPPLLPRRL